MAKCPNIVVDIIDGSKLQSSEQKAFFSAAVMERQTSGNYISHLAHACLLSFALCLYRSSGRAIVADVASGQGEMSDKVCQNIDAPVSLETDVWKHWFSRVRNEKGVNVMDRQEAIRRQYAFLHRGALSRHLKKLLVQNLWNLCKMCWH